MTFDPSVYNNEWYDYLTRFDEHNETAFYAVCALLGKPTSLLDVGSGTGVLVKLAYDMDVYPVDGIELPAFHYWARTPFMSHFVSGHDLCTPFNSSRQYDMVISWEVAEHLPEESADTYCDTLANHTAHWLVMTAAHENQGGDWHLNEQPQSYWIDKLTQRGLTYRADLSERLKIIWTYTTGPMFWLPENVMVFERVINA